jgi:hypothetical protein
MFMMAKNGMRTVRAERDPESGGEFQRGKKRCLPQPPRTVHAAAQPQRLVPLFPFPDHDVSLVYVTRISGSYDLLKKHPTKNLSLSAPKEDRSSLSQSPSSAPPLGHDSTSGASSAPSASSSSFEGS